MQDFEKLGVFYLGSAFDRAAGRADPERLLLYDSKDLVTHAVCVGMTGSGKTGLCITLLEEAAIDGIPAIVIDPKGDLANLLLTFPQLRPEDFAPWINPEEARRKGVSPEEYARSQAESWTKGLAASGQDGARIQRLKDAADFAVYTPGSTAGLPISILKSFAVPEQAILDDAELLRDRINSTVTGLLGLMGITADPIQSREHILLATILGAAWKQGTNLDLAGLIAQIQSPPLTRIGVLDLESFYPSKDRFALAMQLNNLLAAPGFEAWMEGEPLSVDTLLYTPAGKPRISIFSISHLGDAERMFFVTLLLGQVLSWMRSQGGTTSLRAILYMDEIFGYFPPVANPPSKAPLLTLLKQGRAFGLGLVLATQNPVDLDYKGLSNAGTWLLGRLQTERDKARVLDGLEGAAAGGTGKFDRGKMQQILAGLGNRVFLMHNVHDDAPEVFQTRWSLCYLCGPLARTQIKQLMAPRKAAAPPAAAAPKASKAASAGAAATTAAPAPAASSQGGGPGGAGPRPSLDPEIPQFFLPRRGGPDGKCQLVYWPELFGCGKIYYSDSKRGVELEQDVAYLAPITQEAVSVDWHTLHQVELTDADLDKSAEAEALFAPLPADAAKARNYASWKKTFTDELYRNQKLEIFRSPGLKVFSKPEESERDFRVRLQQAAREERDERTSKLREKFAPKLAAFDERIRKAQQAVDRESQQAKQTEAQTAISFGATLLGALLGRKTVSVSTLGRATTAARGVGRSMKEKQDVGRAQESVQALQKQRDELAFQFQTEIDKLALKIDPATEELESISLKPKKTNITVRLVALVWVPYWWSADGTRSPAWE